jgi:N-acetylmuramoyl-L-alanine amidase
MVRQGPNRYGTLQRVLAWAGLLLMLAAFVVLQLLPRTERVDSGGTSASGNAGPISLVVIDAGHGGHDSGTLRDGVLEKDLTLDVARRVDQLVRGNGLQTVLTRADDHAISLADRAAVANEQRDCVFVSIHFDEGNRTAATGVNTYYAAHQATGPRPFPSWLPFVQPVSAEPVNFASQSLAGFVQEALVTRTRAFDRGTRAEQFYVIANVRHPAVLVEGGFLTNNDDIAKLRTESYRQQLAQAIVEGIMRYRDFARDHDAPGEPRA